MSNNLNLFNETGSETINETVSETTKKGKNPAKKETPKKTGASCRDKLLQEYKESAFEPSSKYKNYEDGSGQFLPLDEKIKMFCADFPNGNIECEIVCDNNVFATVRCEIVCQIGKRVAFGKWYHSNNDYYGRNYVATAQSVAISSALRLLGYSVSVEDNSGDPPKESCAFIDNLPAPIPYNPIKEGAAQNVGKNNTEMTFEQAKSFVINNAPFCGRTVGEILEKGEYLDALNDLLDFHANHNTPMSVMAKAVLKEIRT